jgi:hypothetical protein
MDEYDILKYNNILTNAIAVATLIFMVWVVLLFWFG